MEGRADEPPDPLFCLVTRSRSRRGDAVRRVLHRVRDGIAQSESGQRDRAADDRQKQRIFGGRSAGLITQHTNERFHFIIPSTQNTRTPPWVRISAARESEEVLLNIEMATRRMEPK